MDSKLIEDQHLVARYLADQLSDTEREAFEAYCLEHPELFREIEMAARIKGGFARLEKSGELGAVLEKPGFGSFVMRHAASLAAIGVGVALLLGAVYSLRVPAMGASVAEVSGRFRDVLPLAAEYAIERKRDSGAVDRHIELPAHPSVIHLRVLPDVEDRKRYRATLIQEMPQGTRDVESIRGLAPDGDGYVSFFVNSRFLTAGPYLLNVAPDEPGSQDPESNFRIVFESKH
jgi:hypothetical protein